MQIGSKSAHSSAAKRTVFTNESLASKGKSFRQSEAKLYAVRDRLLSTTQQMQTMENIFL